MRRFILIALVVCGMFVGVMPVEAHTRITTEVTWSEHIRPIFAAKCMRCHRPGGSAPEEVDLTRYGTKTVPGARAWAVAIEEELLSGNMPPWKADDRFAPLSDHTRLSTRELDYIMAWISGGAPQGPERNLPTPKEFTKAQWVYGEPDVVMGNDEEPFVLKEGVESETTTYTFSLDIPEDTYITGYEFLIDRPRFVKRIVAFMEASPELYTPPIQLQRKLPYDPVSGVDSLFTSISRDHLSGTHRLGQWYPGDTVVLFPEGAGHYLNKKSTIILQVEYARPDYSSEKGEIRISTRMGLNVAQPSEDIDLFVETMEMSIKPNEGKSSGHTLKESIHIFAITPALKEKGRDIDIRILYPDGRSQTILSIPDFDPAWTTTYQLATPVAAPVGSRILTSGTYDATLELSLDYYLDDHIYIEPVVIPKTEASREGTGMRLGVFSGFGESLGDEVIAPEESAAEYWCPMRGNPCGLDAYAKGDACKDCKMNVVPRAKFFEGLEVAPATYDWRLSKRGGEQTYWCANRGREDHSLVDYPRAGTCEVCEATLLHKAQFETSHTYMCMVPTCADYQQVYYGPGLCTGCGQPVSGLGHMDHTPLHGGWQFFMADNLYHHLEGTMPEPGLFKLYLYDDWKTPLDARNFKGALFIESEDATTGAFTEKEYALNASKEGDTWLTAEIPKAFPVDFYILIWLAGEEKRYDFSFEEVTAAPELSIAENTGFRLHAHNCGPVDIPVTEEALVRAILKRDTIIQANIAAKDWVQLHCPAADSKALVAALALRTTERSTSDRVRMKKVVGMVNRSTLALDYAGDIEDAARVHRAYAEYAEAMGLLRSLYPTLAP